MHTVPSVPVAITRFVNCFPVRIHARSETAFPPVSTRRIRKEVFGRKVIEIPGEKILKKKKAKKDKSDRVSKTPELWIGLWMQERQRLPHTKGLFEVFVCTPLVKTMFCVSIRLDSI